MDDSLCPVCGAYAVTFREKAFLLTHYDALTCHGCGAKLGLSRVDSVFALVPCVVLMGLGFTIGGMPIILTFMVIGILVSWWCSVKFVRLVPKRGVY